MARRVLRDARLKLLAVGLAVVLWLSVAGEPVVERGLEVPLGFENVPEDLEIAGTPPDTVRVRVSGASSIVSRLEPGDVVAVLDLAGEDAGRGRLFDMFAGRVRAPFGVDIIQVVPATITVSLERAGVPRTVPIVPDIEGQPAAGYVVGRISTAPATVDVVGSDSRLAELVEALTAPVSVAGAFARVQAIVTVGVADPTLRPATPSSAEVTVEIVPAPVEVTLQEVPVAMRGAERRVDGRAEPQQVTVSVSGPRETIEGLDRSAVEAYVDLVGLAPGQYNLPVTVESQQDIGVTHIEPPSVRIDVR